MKLSFFAILFFSLCMSSCNKDSEPAGTDVGNGTMTALIDGSSWSSKNTNNGVVYADVMGSHTIQAEADDGSLIIMTVLGAVSAGDTFTVAGGQFTPQYKLSISDGNAFVASGGLGTGSITFTTYNNNKVKGTFQFSGKRFLPDATQEEVAITNGEFEINL